MLRHVRAKLAPVTDRFRQPAGGQATHGRGEIRTPETGVARLPVFKTGAFNRSATLPRAETGRLVDPRLAQSSSQRSLAGTIIQRSGAADISLIGPNRV
jgi:hypothetical protein